MISQSSIEFEVQSNRTQSNQKICIRVRLNSINKTFGLVRVVTRGIAYMLLKVLVCLINL